MKFHYHRYAHYQRYRKGKKQPKMSLKGQFSKLRKARKMRFFLVSQGFFNSQIRFLGQNVCSVGRTHTDRHGSQNRGHTFRVSGIFIFSFNLTLRSGPIAILVYVKRQTDSALIYLLKSREAANRGTGNVTANIENADMCRF